MTSTAEGDRCYKNPFTDTEKDFDLSGRAGAEFRIQLKEASSRLLNQLVHNIQSGGDISGDDYSIYTGSTGLILTLHFVSTQDSNPNPFLKQVCNNFLRRVLDGNMLKKKRFTFLTGDSGPFVVAYVMSTDPQEKLTLLKQLLDLQDLVYKDIARDGSDTPNELLYGRVGYLYSLLFLNQQCPQNPPVVPSSVISKLTSFIIEDGLRKHRAGGPPLQFEWHDKMYLGAAHGYVGILYILLKAKEFLKAEHALKVKETVDWVLTERFPSGNLRSSVGSKEDKLVHWCHGASGAVFLFLEAAMVYKEQRYLSCALGCGEVIWTRGILKKGYSICHGTAGNAYALMYLYKHTQDELWLRRSCLFARWCFSWGKHTTRQPDRPNSLFEGLAGSVYMLHDFLHSAFPGSGGSIAKLPAFELD